MKLEIREKGTPAFYREVVCIMVQYGRFLKKPGRKVIDSFRQLTTYMAICALFLVLLVVMGIAWGMDALTIVAIFVMVAAMTISGIQLFRLQKLTQTLLEDPRSSLFTFDQQGVEINKEDTQILRVSWDNVAFVRVFPQSVCIFAKSIRGPLFALPRKLRPQVLGFLREKAINVQVIEN